MGVIWQYWEVNGRMGVSGRFEGRWQAWAMDVCLGGLLQGERIYQHWRWVGGVGVSGMNVRIGMDGRFEVW